MDADWPRIIHAQDAEIKRLTEHSEILHGQLQRMIDRWDAQQAENARLRQALQTYATDLCENANQDWCGMMSAVECAGCLARQALKGQTHD